MASALYLENFLESIENLPQELRRNFALMRDLDQRTEDLKTDVERNSQTYCRTASRMSKEDRVCELNKIQDLFKKAVENSDNKVQIAMQMYEMVDKYIRKLDAELSRFEHELQLKDSAVSRASISSISDLPSGLARHRKRSGGGGGEGGGGNAGPSRKRNRMVSNSAEEAGTSGLATPGAVGMAKQPPTDVLDMPVDPNEPTYCLCHQVSFGEMIGCDNADCPIEWFHFQCVGLTAKPKGRWFCPKCTQEKEKKKKY